MTAVAGFLLPRKHVVELELAGARPQHEEPLAGGEGTAHETALILICLPEYGNGSKPGEEDRR